MVEGEPPIKHQANCDVNDKRTLNGCGSNDLALSNPQPIVKTEVSKVTYVLSMSLLAKCVNTLHQTIFKKRHQKKTFFVKHKSHNTIPTSFSSKRFLFLYIK